MILSINSIFLVYVNGTNLAPEIKKDSPIEFFGFPC